MGRTRDRTAKVAMKTSSTTRNKEAFRWHMDHSH